MNLALPALLVILALLPGITFVKGYFAGRFPRRLAQLSALTEVALYIAFSLPIDAIALRCLGSHPFAAELAMRLLTGHVDEASVKPLADAFVARWPAAAMSYLFVLGSAFIVAVICRRIIWTTRLDTRWPLLRMRHAWYYTLQGRLRGLPRDLVAWVDVLAELPGDKPRLYRGVVGPIETGPDGELTELVLEHAFRGKNRGDDFEFLEIHPSNQFLIRGEHILSINVWYEEILRENETRWKRISRTLVAYGRSLFLEEP